MKKTLITCIMLTLSGICLMSCGGDDKEDDDIQTKDIAVTGACIETGENYAIIEGYVNLSNVTASYTSQQIGVECSLDESFSAPKFVKTSVLEGNKFTVTIGGLWPGTEYYYRTCVKINSLSYVGEKLSFRTTGTAKNDDDIKPEGHSVDVTDGFYVVCSGNTSSSINGALTYFDYTSLKATPNAFEVVNGKSLGMTVNDAVRYGDKLYIVVGGEHKVFVTDANTLKLINTIDMTSDAMLGVGGGAHPRRITANGSNVYVSTYGGYVAAIDTVNFTLKQKYEVGSYPEGLVVSDGILYVVNSDYGNGEKPSISKVNLANGSVTEIKNENIRNPQEIAVVGSFVYFLDYGQYGPAPTYAQEHAGVYCINPAGNITCVIPNATAMATAGYYIYTINAPYGRGEISYNIYNISSGTLLSFTPVDIESPACIGVDPVSGNVMIASYHMIQTDWGPFADYSGNGYVNIYDANVASKLVTFECGVGPQRFSFNIGIK